jgi:hypothetical protein
VPSGGSQPIFNRNIVNVVLPPMPPPSPSKDGRDYDYSYYRGPTEDAPLFDYFSSGFVMFVILLMLLLCLTTMWVAMQSPPPPQQRDRSVIRYRLVRATQHRQEEPGEGGCNFVNREPC